MVKPSVKTERNKTAKVTPTQAIAVAKLGQFVTRIRVIVLLGCKKPGIRGLGSPGGVL